MNPSFPSFKKRRKRLTTVPDVTTVTTSSARVTSITRNERKERIIPLDSDDKVSVLRLMKDFDFVTANSRLHLNTAPLRFQYFARCLIGAKRDDWQAVIDNQPQNTIEHFNERISEFLDMIFVPTDLIDQKNYLMKLKKPYKLSCTELSSRLRYINSLMRWMPGANNTPPFSENDLKVMFYNMMLEPWKLNFQQSELSKLLKKYSRLFSGELGEYKDEKVHLIIDPKVKPSRCRPYTVPRNLMKVFKEELDRLVRIGVLEKCGRSEWIAGTFIIPKKDGCIRWISDFRALNKALTRQVYHLPKIGDILARRTNYAFFTKLDVSMQYYTFVLDDESKKLTTIATPFGTYRYLRLPMGISQSPDIAQEIMEKVLHDLFEEVEVYIDDIGCFSTSWDKHMSLLNIVLSRLEDAGFTINPLKCEWGVKETDFLGHWLTPNGHKPWKKKSHVSPLTNLLGTKVFNWGSKQQKSFQEMKAIVARDALLAYPDNSIPFDIETDASDYQLGAVIKQKGRPIAYYSRKLNSAQPVSRLRSPWGRNRRQKQKIEMQHAYDLADGLLVHPDFDEEGRHPFQFDTVHEYQIRDRGLQSCVNSRQEYQRHLYGSKTLVTYCKDGEEPKICIPDEMLSWLVKYYHEISAHVEGATRLEKTIRRHYFHPKLSEAVQKLVLSCDTCQKNKRGSKTYGQLAPREAVLLPWQEIHCDSIGP
ncbi:reverse transcriptase RNA-dependent DNA polymerase [Nitzschia inconspicua]|uniref:Reverse transcriptase RNA-dependent DNA polymerase n=1 Tax=Nitzschia inconspicua TaxID=303405 RepID=A0A9K3KLL1_9STRA|nr:reverse transcriptase RNA-dependent DNA polymerase [Nitzschia inconspicua]